MARAPDRSTATPTYAVVSGDFEADAAAIVNLWSEQPDFGSRARAKLDRAYRGNPAGPGEALLLRVSDQPAPIGVLCLHRRRLWLGQHLVDARVLADYVVTRRQRSLGPALALMREGVRRATAQDGLLYGLPNPLSQAVTRRVGVPVACDMGRSGKLLRSAFLWRHRTGVAGWGRVAGWAADGLLNLVDRVLGWRYGCLRRWRRAGLDDLALQAVWDRRPAAWLISQRSPQMLAWRFESGPGQPPWQIDIAESTTGQAIGYVVWRRLEGGVAQIGDFFVCDPGRRTAALLLGFARRIREGQDVLALSLEFAGAPAVARGLRDAGFVTKAETEPLVALWGAGAMRVAAAAWYMTTFDRDPDV